MTNTSPPDLREMLREATGAAKAMAATVPKRPWESSLLVVGGIAGACLAGLLPGIGEPLRAAAVLSGAGTAALVSHARHKS